MPEEQQNESNEFMPEDPAFQENGLDSGPPPASGPRPAEGARQGAPGDILSEGFNGADTAGDFLGLDLEFTAPDSADAEKQPLELELASPPGSTSKDPEVDYDAEFDLDGPTQIMHADEEYSDDDYGEEYAAGDSDDEFESESEFESEFDPEYEAELEGEAYPEDLELAPAPSGRGRLLAGVFVAAVVAVGGAMLGPRFLKQKDGGPKNGGGKTEIARGSGPNGAETAATAMGGSELVDPIAVDPVDGGPLNADPIEDPAFGGGTENQTGVELATTDPVDTNIDPVTVDFSTGTGGNDPGPMGEQGTFGNDPLDGLRGGVSDPSGTEVSEGPTSNATLAISTSSSVFPEFVDENYYDWVSDDQLDIVWRGTDVPMQAIRAPSHTLMPRVGNVRVHMTSGRTLDGKLYAVGRNRVWLDIAPGRVGLDGEAVERFDHLADELAPTTSLASSHVTPQGGRVRVAVPGGSLIGRVLKSDEESVTMVLDDGAKITVRGAEPVPLGTRRAIVLDK